MDTKALEAARKAVADELDRTARKSERRGDQDRANAERKLAADTRRGVQSS